MRINTAIIAGLGVVALWASAFPAIRVAAPASGVIGLSFIRLTVAAVTLVHRYRTASPRTSAA